MAQQHENKESPAKTGVAGTHNSGIERAILTGKQGPATPVPSWKLHLENCSFDNDSMMPGTGRDTPVMSARKLAATLWELELTPAFTCTLGNASTSKLHPWTPDHSISTAQHISLLRSPSISNLFPKSATPSSHYRKPRKNVRISKALPEKLKRRFLEDSRDMSEVSKILNHIQKLEERNTSSRNLAAVLHVELEHAYAQIRELELTYRAVQKEMDKLLRKLADERATSRRMEKEKIRSAMQNLKEDIEDERKSKHQLEITISSLGGQLGEANVALSRALQDLERERKTRELLEDVCNELAREIGHEKFEVEELKLASAKVKEEVEQERKMLQMAEMWREERVQMKLAEAQFQLQEKNAALDKLRVELEEFLCNRRNSEGFMDLSCSFGTVHMNGRRNSSYEPWEMNGSGSIVDDLHLVDLNKGCRISGEDVYGSGYHSDSHQAKIVRLEGLGSEHTVVLKEKKLKSRCSRLKDRARMLERLRRTDKYAGSYKEDVSTNNDIVWEFGSDTKDKKNGDTLPDGETKERFKSSTINDSTSKRKEKQGSDHLHHIVSMKIEDHQGPSHNKPFISAYSQGNSVLPMSWEADARGGHTKNAAWKLGFVASENTSSLDGELHLQSQKGDFQTVSLEGQCSSPTTDSGSSLHVLVPENSRNLQKPSLVFNRHFAKGFKSLVEWRKHKKMGNSPANFLVKDVNSQDYLKGGKLI
ncbi:hypothetical protein O6H91_05G066700 [Diphasiastrum complanatum]|uniref:Uncharacterized protein n=1 Tax=Diphasiastrum complanatum TaxID=34168 RepID=A0ACC2DPN6_DIPCM|nr:hypothetical protein O6H91_05G066700 [Diphasiastrum complanatum]